MNPIAMKNTRKPDPNDKGYARHEPKAIPLPDARSAEDEAIGHEETDPASGNLPTGIQTGQTTRGSYATDSSTGGGRYQDHTGVFAERPVAQPGTDQEKEPDPVDPKL